MAEKIFDHIAADPNVKFGKPVIEGTRVPVDLIVGKIAGGMTTQEVMREYDLTQTQVQAAPFYTNILYNTNNDYLYCACSSSDGRKKDLQSASHRNN